MNRKIDHDPENTVVRSYSSLSDLPDHVVRLFRSASKENVYLSQNWFLNLEETTLDEFQRVRVFVAETQSGDRALVALCMKWPAPNQQGATSSPWALTSPYTIFYDVVCEPDVNDVDTLIGKIVEALVRDARSISTITLDCIRRDSPTFALLSKHLRANGFIVEEYFHFGNWYDVFMNTDFENYRQSLKSGIRRLMNRVSHSKKTHFRLVETAEELDSAIARYEALSLLRWSTPEPYEQFIRGLVYKAFEEKFLRFGLLEVKGEVVAAQIWLISNKNATIFKVAHDPAIKNSIGSTLTLCLVKHVLEIDGVTEIDFGRGDDDYKKSWLRKRQECWGLRAYNLRTFGGLAGSALYGTKRLARLIHR